MYVDKVINDTFHICSLCHATYIYVSSVLVLPCITPFCHGTHHLYVSRKNIVVIRIKQSVFPLMNTKSSRNQLKIEPVLSVLRFDSLMFKQNPHHHSLNFFNEVHVRTQLFIGILYDVVLKVLRFIFRVQHRANEHVVWNYIGTYLRQRLHVYICRRLSRRRWLLLQGRGFRLVTSDKGAFNM